MAVRRGDAARRAELDDFLVRRRARRRRASCDRYGVPRVEGTDVLECARRRAAGALTSCVGGLRAALRACCSRSRGCAGCERETRRYQELPAAANRETGVA